MQVQVLISKIHRATVTNSNINYIGCINIDEELMNASNPPSIAFTDSKNKLVKGKKIR